MTWEETILYIRTKDEYKDLVRLAYLDVDLAKNGELYKSGEEYIEILKIFRHYAPNAKNILDIGCGNGISALSFAIEGYHVTAVEPDKSETIGAGAIKKLKQHYNLSNIEIFEDFAENIKFPDNSFDIVFARQSMHHAHDLQKFVEEMARVLKPGGLFLTVRDHVVFNESDKKRFLESHPLQKYYHGENAYKPKEYKNAIAKANLKLIKELKYFDSIINYFPLKSTDLEKQKSENIKSRKESLRGKIGLLSNFKILLSLYSFILDKKYGKIFDEKNVPGRMYSYIALKN